MCTISKKKKQTAVDQAEVTTDRVGSKWWIVVKVELKTNLGSCERIRMQKKEKEKDLSWMSYLNEVKGD